MTATDYMHQDAVAAELARKREAERKGHDAMLAAIYAQLDCPIDPKELPHE